jgi:hypothetical protein
MLASGTTQKLLRVLILMLFTFRTYATETPMLERTITITLKQERMDVALKKIAEQGGFVFSYNPAIIDAGRIVNLNFSNKTIREVLNELFDGGISFKERRKYIILTRATEKESRVVKGYVVDEQTGEHLQNVSVYDPVTLSSTVTDSYGYFQMKVNKPTSDLILAVNKENYTDTIVAVAGWRKSLLKIPIKNSTKRIAAMTDSVRSKIRRIWKSKFFAHENLKNISDTIYRKYQISLLPFIGTNHKLSANVINDYSFNIYGGYSRGVRKLEIGGTFNIVRNDVRGVQIAGSFNAVNGKVKGWQFSGGINFNRDSLKGGQVGVVNLNWNSVRNFAAAGFLNITRNDSRGLIMAGIGNITTGEQRGVHVAGIVNASVKNAKAFQFAGIANYTGGELKGAQIAGLGNIANDVLGLQSAALFNFAYRNMKGAQVAGLVNYAKKVKGVQLGFINVADSVDGVPIGFLSFVLKGYHKLEISADEIFYTNIAFRSGAHKFFNILTAGIKPQNNSRNYWSVGYGFGTAPKLTNWLSMNIDLTSNQVSYGNFTEAINLLNKFYVGFDVRLIKGVSVALGATLNGYLTDNNYHQYTSLFTDYKPKVFTDHTYNNNVNLKMWMGGKVGLRFF